jgi:hypothetical protein
MAPTFGMLYRLLFALGLVTLWIKITDLIEYIERLRIKNVDSHAKASRIKAYYSSTNRIIIGFARKFCF